MSKTIRLNLGKISSSPQTNRQSVDQAGRAGNELARLGQTISSTGQKLGSIVERRRAEEDRDTISRESSRDSIMSKAERKRTYEERRENPIGMAKDLQAAQEKRHNETLKGVTSERAKKMLNQKFELSRLETQMDAVTEERLQFTKNGVKHEINSADEEAEMDFQFPTTPEEFGLELATKLEFINQRDFDDDTKLKITKAVTETRVKGIVSGYMKGGKLSDFARSEKLIAGLSANGLIDEKLTTGWNNKIDSARRTKMNNDIFMESQEVKFAEKMFDASKNEVGAELLKVIENPGYDPSANLKGLSDRGVVSSGANRILTESKMSPAQLKSSEGVKYSLMDELSQTNNPKRVRELINQNVLTGKLSAEAGVEVLKSATLRLDNKLNNAEISSSNSILKDQATSGTLFTGIKVDREKLYKLKVRRDQIMTLAEGRTSSVEAAQIALKESGILKGSSPVSGLQSDQSTEKGINEAIEEVVDKQSKMVFSKEKELNNKIATGKYRALQRRLQAIKANEAPTLEEILSRGK